MDTKSEPKLSRNDKIFLAIETTILRWLVPTESPGPVFRWLFKIPILLYSIGLGSIVRRRFLLITTIGRKSGKKRTTPLEFQLDPSSNCYLVMAGWKGNTDWCRNARRDPHVHVQVGRRSFDAIAEPLSQEEVAQFLTKMIRLNPKSLKMISRWSTSELQDTPESIYRAAQFFPSFRLKPVD